MELDTTSPFSAAYWVPARVPQGPRCLETVGCVCGLKPTPGSGVSFLWTPHYCRSDSWDHQEGMPHLWSHSVARRERKTGGSRVTWSS